MVAPCTSVFTGACHVVSHGQREVPFSQMWSAELCYTGRGTFFLDVRGNYVTRVEVSFSRMGEGLCYSLFSGFGRHRSAELCYTGPRYLFLGWGRPDYVTRPRYLFLGWSRPTCVT